MPRINELTSPECMEYINEGGNLAFVPIGGIERLGPHLPLGARGMVADAIAMYLAEKMEGCVCRCCRMVRCMTLMR